MKLYEEFREYENMWTPNDQHEDKNELYVEGENKVVPKVFSVAIEKLDNFFDSIDDIDVDSYDDSYNDGEHLQCRHMWNVFEPITFDIEEAEAAVESLLTSIDPDKVLSIYFDKDMLEDDGMLNICLSLEADLLENLPEHTNQDNKTVIHRTAAEIQAEIAKLQQELANAEIAEKRASYSKLPNTLYIWDMYKNASKKGTWCSAEKDGIDWEGIVFETEDDAANAAWTLLKELEDENELTGDPDEYTIDIIPVPFRELTAEILEYSDLEHLIPPIE